LKTGSTGTMRMDMPISRRERVILPRRARFFSMRSDLRERISGSPATMDSMMTSSPIMSSS